MQREARPEPAAATSTTAQPPTKPAAPTPKPGKAPAAPPLAESPSYDDVVVAGAAAATEAEKLHVFKPINFVIEMINVFDEPKFPVLLYWRVTGAPGRCHGPVRQNHAHTRTRGAPAGFDEAKGMHELHLLEARSACSRMVLRSPPKELYVEATRAYGPHYRALHFPSRSAQAPLELEEGLTPMQAPTWHAWVTKGSRHTRRALLAGNGGAPRPLLSADPSRRLP